MSSSGPKSISSLLGRTLRDPWSDGVLSPWVCNPNVPWSVDILSPSVHIPPHLLHVVFLVKGNPETGGP